MGRYSKVESEIGKTDRESWDCEGRTRAELTWWFVLNSGEFSYGFGSF
jgi:hypothetical protein